MASKRKRKTPSSSSLDEFRLIAGLERLLPRQPRRVLVGRGADDAAVVSWDDEKLVATCDVQVEGTHFQLSWMSPLQIGMRCASANLSDLASMGAEPRYALVSIIMPKATKRRFFNHVMQGIATQLEKYGAHVVGGNIARGKSQVVVDMTLLGAVDETRLLTRAGARPGDKLLVTGQPGETAAGLALLQAGAADVGSLKKRFRVPPARIEAGRELRRLGATSAIDISDGLTGDLLHLCEASRCGVRLLVEQLPRSKTLLRAAKRLQVDATDWVLGGGEAYELLFTAPAARIQAIRKRLEKRNGLEVSEIGDILPARQGRWLRRDEVDRVLRGTGFKHFS